MELGTGLSEATTTYPPPLPEVIAPDTLLYIGFQLLLNI